MNAPHEKAGGGAGTVMLVLFWLVLLGVLASVFNDFFDKRANPNQNVEGTSTERYREVTLTSTRNGHYVATGTINGKEVTFLVDTGASLVAVPAKFEKALGLRRGAQGISSTAGGNVTSWSTNLDTVTLGNIQLRNVRASINPSMNNFSEILLGMSFLRDLELTHRDDTLTIRQWR